MGKAAGVKTLRIGFLSCKNYFDRQIFSGILYSMYQALGRHAEVVPLGRPYVPGRFRGLLAAGKRRLGGRRPGFDLDMADCCRDIERQITQQSLDIVFAPVASQELAILKLRRPVVYASDVTCRLLYGNYEFGVSPDQLAEAEAAERAAIESATGITYPSAWAADSAVRDYGAGRDKIRVIPWGANLEEVPDEQAIFAKWGRRPWKLVLVGLYWHRKGGDIALKAFRALRARGLEAELTIIGMTPPERVDGAAIRVIPYLNKHKPRDRRILQEILLSSHAMLFPTRADCSPSVLCEAAAHGVPVVAADVGGISSIVTNQTGRVMSLQSTPEDYAAAVMELVSDPDRYREMIRSSRQRFDEVLNWNTWAESVVRFCEELV